MKIIILIILLAFPLGQLTRVELSSGVAVYPHDLMALLALIIWAVRFLKHGRSESLSLAKPIFLFAATLLFSLLIGAKHVPLNQALIGSLYLIRWLALTGVYFFSLDLFRKTVKVKVFGRKYEPQELLLISGVSLSFLGLMQYLLFPDLRQLKWLGWDDHLFRLAGTIFDPGFTGILTLLTLILAFDLKLKPQVKLFSVAASLVSLLLTYSRASYVSFFFAGLTLGLLKRKLKYVLIAVAVMSLLPLLPAPGGQGVNLARVYSVKSRLTNWGDAIKIAEDRPLFGVGFNLLRFRKHQAGLLGENWRTDHAGAGIENSFLFLLSTSGIVGLTAFLYLLYKYLILGLFVYLKNSNSSTHLLVSLVAVSVHAIFNNTWFYPWVLIWMWYMAAAAESKNAG